MDEIVDIISLIFSMIFGIAFIGFIAFIVVCTIVYSIKDLINYKDEK